MSIYVRAKIDKTIYKNDTFRILACTPVGTYDNLVVNRYGDFIIKGDLDLFEENREYDMYLVQDSHPTYGLQYRVVNIPMVENLEELTPEQNFNLLKQITTDRQAENIQAVYPNFVSLVLQGKADTIDYKKIYNVGEVYFDVYVREILRIYGKWALTQQFSTYNFTEAEAKTLLEKSAGLEGAKKIINDRPYYCLCHLLDRYFPSIDPVILEERPELKLDHERIESLLQYLLKTNEQAGNTRIEVNELCRHAYDYDAEIWSQLKDVIMHASYLKLHEESKNISNLRTYNIELDLAHWIQELLQPDKQREWDITWQDYCCNRKLQLNLTNEQSQLLYLITQYNLVLLTGSAGSGKTSSVDALLYMLENQKKTYTLLAPTGIASKRLHESTGCPASTIHRRYCSDSMIETDVVIVDEISMLSIEHYAMLMSMINIEVSKVVLIGDNAQLASIGAGNVFADILKWGKIPHANLTHIFRYGKGSIATIATDVRNKTAFLSNKGELIYQGHDNDTQYEFHRIQENFQQQILSEYKKLLQDYNQDEIVILTPYNIYQYGTYSINQLIQNMRFGDKEGLILKKRIKNQTIQISYHVNDRVLCTKNNYHACTYDADFKDGKGAETSIYNGDIGTIRFIDQEQGSIVVEFDEEMVVIDKADLKDILLGYAMTIHKVQGSQAKAIILITHSSHKPMLTSNLLYVALTRAQEKIVHLGSPLTINRAIPIDATETRDTWLYDFLTERWEEC